MAQIRDSVSPLESEILAYLGGRPDAGDPLEGITHWWMALRPGNTATVVRIALQQLTAGG